MVVFWTRELEKFCLIVCHDLYFAGEKGLRNIWSKSTWEDVEGTRLELLLFVFPIICKTICFLQFILLHVCFNPRQVAVNMLLFFLWHFQLLIYINCALLSISVSYFSLFMYRFSSITIGDLPPVQSKISLETYNNNHIHFFLWT